MSHGDHVKELLERGKAGQALAYLAQQLDRLEADRAAAPSLDWSVDDNWEASEVVEPWDDPEVHRTLHARLAQLVEAGKDWPTFEGGPVLKTADFGWDGSPDTWTKEIGEAMYRKAIELIGDPLPGDDGEWAARRGLAADLRTPPTRDVLYIKGETIGNAGYTAGEADEAVDVLLPTPTDEEREERRQFAVQMGWDKPDWLLPTGGSPIIESFVEGGPLLMFHGYREYLAQVPPAMLQRMIAMHARRFPEDAAIMTADLLRAEDTLDYESALDHGAQFSKTLPGGKG